MSFSFPPFQLLSSNSGPHRIPHSNYLSRLFPLSHFTPTLAKLDLLLLLISPMFQGRRRKSVHQARKIHVSLEIEENNRNAENKFQMGYMYTKKKTKKKDRRQKQKY